MVTGGWWEADGSQGEYRLVVTQDGWEHVWSRHHLQWLVTPMERGEKTISASVALDYIGSPWWVSAPRLEFRDNAPVLVIDQTHNSSPKAKRVVEVHPRAPGEYSAVVVSETHPADP